MKTKTNNGATVYSSKFKDIKDILPRLYATWEIIPLLKSLPKFKIKTQTNEFAIKPTILLEYKTKSVEITDYIQFVSVRGKWQPSPECMPVGYKRQDDFLGNDGKLLPVSAKFRRDLEYLRCGRSWVRWVIYKLTAVFR